MRVLIILALAATALTTACGEPTPKAPPPPADADMTFKGSYAQSCRNVTTPPNGYLKAECAGVDGFLPTKIQASLCEGDIGNNNGVLVCNGTTAVDPESPNTPAPPKPAEPAKSSDADDAPEAGNTPEPGKAKATDTPAVKD